MHSKNSEASKGEKQRKGFTLIELMVVLLIFGLILAIAVPNYIKYMGRAGEEVCIVNLRAIRDAIQNYALDNNLADDVEITVIDIVPNYLRRFPSCPSGGWYSFGLASEDPKCTIPGHQLP